MKGSALTAAAALMPGGALAARNANETEATNAAQNAAKPPLNVITSLHSSLVWEVYH